MTVETKCEVCDQIVEYSSDGDRTCSEFCAALSDTEMAAFKKLEPGEFGLWPCAESGCIVEDEYTPGGCCYKCFPKKRLRIRTALLVEADARLSALVIPDRTDRILITDFVERIKKELQF